MSEERVTATRPALSVSPLFDGPPADDPASGPRSPAVANALDRWRATWWPLAEELGEGPYLARTALLVLAVVMVGFFVDLAFVGRLEHDAAQTRAFNRFRVQLANGIAPTGQLDARGRLLPAGTPVALLEIRAIGLREVVSEGTSSSSLESGPGHVRTTVLPGQAGISTIFGRASAYGGPFGGLHRLRHGEKITVTTGVGSSTFVVLDLRRAGDPVPPLASGSGRLVLATAAGAPFLPSGVLWVDADLTTSVQPSAGLALAGLPRNQLPMATDTSSLWVLAFLLQALILVTIGAVWSWRRWGRSQTWVVFFPLTALIAYYVGDQVTRLLPNLL